MQLHFSLYCFCIACPDGRSLIIKRLISFGNEAVIFQSTYRWFGDNDFKMHQIAINSVSGKNSRKLRLQACVSFDSVVDDRRPAAAAADSNSSLGWSATVQPTVISMQSSPSVATAVDFHGGRFMLTLLSISLSYGKHWRKMEKLKMTWKAMEKKAQDGVVCGVRSCRNGF